MTVPVAVPIAALLLLCACATPPNTAVLRFESVPSAAAVLSPGGVMLGVTPFSINLPLKQDQIVASAVRLGTGTAVWSSGATVQVNFDFKLNGLSSGTVRWDIQRPNAAPGLLADVKFAEDRARQARADANEGWGVLADLVREQNRQRASLPRINDPLASPTIGRPSIECTSKSVWPNEVQTTCK